MYNRDESKIESISLIGIRIPIDVATLITRCTQELRKAINDESANRAPIQDTHCSASGSRLPLIIVLRNFGVS
jgi:hypothetical protein